MNKSIRKWLALILAAILALLPISSQAAPNDTVRVSVASDGTQGNGGSINSSVSADGRYVVFVSYSSNLTDGDTNSEYDVFLHDTQTGETKRVSVATNGAQGNSMSGDASISADGRFIVFTSVASNLTPGDDNWADDVFLHDTQTGETTRVSVATNGAQGDNSSYDPSISTDGHYVAFASWATNLSANDTNAERDVFLHDMQSGVTTLISVASDGTQGCSTSERTSISADGRYVTFESDAFNLVAGDTNGKRDIFLHDMQTGGTIRVSLSPDGTQRNDHSTNSSISADGRYVVYEFGYRDIFLYDTQTGVTTLISVSSTGTQGNGISSSPSISANGRHVAFHSLASNLVSNDFNGKYDVFVHDTWNGEVTRASLSSNGEEGSAQSYFSSISGDGKYVVFTSAAVNLVSGDTNAVEDIFLHENEIPIFVDVPPGYWAKNFVERLYLANVTGGCGGGNFCPDQKVTRAQMAVFVLSAKHGPGYVPPAATGEAFSDVAQDSFAAAWIEQMATEGITGGCGGGNFCPNASITRAQMAVFLVKGMYGTAYVPPAATGGVFTDVASDSFAAAFIEKLAADGITGGCGSGKYCPNASITRAEMAVFLVMSFNLP
jgi:Tol biopolymer transport system component